MSTVVRWRQTGLPTSSLPLHGRQRPPTPLTLPHGDAVSLPPYPTVASSLSLSLSFAPSFPSQPWAPPFLASAGCDLKEAVIFSHTILSDILRISLPSLLSLFLLLLQAPSFACLVQTPFPLPLAPCPLPRSPTPTAKGMCITRHSGFMISTRARFSLTAPKAPTTPHVSHSMAVASDAEERPSQ